ncbi:hypothetical protein HYD79_00945 [Mycoplasmopsis bovis]|nr:hypothetical protein [Mycoplasmopsis bovis]QQH43026.1 hypothetical protein HYD79_00945 [Mycoplasmopsis bovis]
MNERWKKGFLTQAECYTKYLSETIVVDKETGKDTEFLQNQVHTEYIEII